MISISGTSTGSAPSTINRSTRSPACSLALVTTTRRPASGRTGFTVQPSPEDVFDDREPAVCGEPQRLDVDALVVAVEAGAELRRR